MARYKSYSELKNEARIKLSGNYGNAILTYLMIGLTVLVVIFPISLILSFLTLFGQMGGTPSLLSISNGINEVLDYALTVFVQMFAPGLALFYLNLACKKNATSGDAFFGFRWSFKKSIILAVIMTAINIVFSLPSELIEISSESPFTPIAIGKTALIFIVCNVAMEMVLLPLSQVYYLMLDFPQYSVGELIKFSIDKMKGNNLRLLGLKISFWPIYILGFLSFGIGFLWIIPYRTMTMTQFFLDLMNPEEV